MSKKILYSGELDLNGFKLPCYVLEDGTRVLSGHAMQNALKMVDENESNKSGTRLARYLSQKTLKPFIFKGKEGGHYNPIICINGSSKVNGYEATVLVDICEAFLEARKTINLNARQLIIANQCEILIRGFARVGIIALVDEATGYQYEREHDELQKILKAYISPELLPWQKKFPDIFYKEIFRLNGWNYTVQSIKKRPGVVGKWTNKFVYEQLPKDVLKQLKAKTPKSKSGNYTARFFQSLTVDVGEPHLQAQLTQIVTLFQVSDDWKHFIQQFNKLLDRKNGVLEIQFKDFEPSTFDITPMQTTLDKPLKGLLNVPPPPKEKE
jgi:hypothetical protein